MHRVLLVPGLHNSGPEHWQSQWHQRFPTWQRLDGLPWDQPNLTIWSERLADVLAQSPEPVHLVAHSFGTLTAVAASRLQPDKVASLFLAAPADPERFGIVERRLSGSLPAPALLVASRSDPWMSFERASRWSRLWQTPLFDAGAVGHINVESGHGEWGDGLALLADLHGRQQRYRYFSHHRQQRSWRASLTG
ncbi:hypothetical protein SAMN05880558_10796 [Aeromonas sp. RU39B]|uniref:RBBP9/YdeN family alpha/beta hydrolase n=1 Tax=Aeromonas sp. RU39B TaxID=1907416 RepID=UPI00095536D3|nr:alpha/beta hydrolase [Aeromonas sp. RU39B]SIQ95698.1 hypothetical protein SAMN05880558_10796 [Aeromonas sp. RU39B]